MKIVTTIAGTALVALVITGCSPAPEDQATDESVLADPDLARDTNGAPGTATTGTETGMPRVADLVSNPTRYAGQIVTIEADVDEVFGPRAFSVDEDSPLAGGVDNDLIVLSRQTGAVAELNDDWADSRVRIMGTVGTTGTAELEKELGWGLTPELRSQLEEADAVLIADTVTRIDD